jgi:hypothetical protein
VCEPIRNGYSDMTLAGAQQLLEVEDLCDAAKPDERSVMTYVASFFHAFSSQGKHWTYRIPHPMTHILRRSSGDCIPTRCQVRRAHAIGMAEPERL